MRPRDLLSLAWGNSVQAARTQLIKHEVMPTLPHQTQFDYEAKLFFCRVGPKEKYDIIIVETSVY